jgi:hypothetical protein
MVTLLMIHEILYRPPPCLHIPRHQVPFGSFVRSDFHAGRLSNGFLDFALTVVSRVLVSISGIS